MEKYLIKYLLDHEKNPLRAKYIEYFKTEMDWFTYNYGDHISKTHQKKQPYNYKEFIFRYYRYLSTLLKKPTINTEKSIILSPFRIEDLESDYKFISSILYPGGFSDIIGDLKTIRLIERKQRIINYGGILDFLDSSFISEWEELKGRLINQYKQYNIKGAFFHADQYFEQKYLIDIFKDLNIPSFVFVHGLPSCYTLDVYNRTDYMMVWGERMKELYISAGVESSKIHVVGNRKYPHYCESRDLRNTLDDILVIPPSAAQWHQDTWGDPLMVDRSVGILYLYQVENVLKKKGIKRARYRIHPSIDKSWTDAFLDHSFYEVDKKPLDVSLNQATIVIGSATSVLFDAVAHGVNYILYEPQEKGMSLLGAQVVPPFDGSDGFIVSKTEVELSHILDDRPLLEMSSIDRYMTPFNSAKIKNLLHR